MRAVTPKPIPGASQVETVYAYDEAGNQISEIDAENRETKFEYDSLGRNTKRILPEGQEETFTYDAVGNVLTNTDSNGYTTEFVYDAMNRLVEQQADPTHPSLNLGNATARITWTYTATGQVEMATVYNASNTVLYNETFTYNERDRVLSKATSHGMLSYTYDATDNILSVQSSNANGLNARYTYDDLNRLKTAEDNNFIPPGVNTYTYDAVGNLESLIYANGVTHIWNYDTLNRLTGLLVSDAGNLSIANYQYTLDNVGNRTQVQELSGRVVDYTYDDLHRLTQEAITGGSGPVGTVSYSYDAVGNRLSRTSGLIGVNNQSFTYSDNDLLDKDIYDANGNTIQSDGNTDTYDFLNRLVKRTTAGGDVLEYLYDASGIRVSKIVNMDRTDYLVDTNNLTGFAQVVEELDASLVKKVYLYGLDLISMDQDTGVEFEINYYIYDGLGSVRALTDETGLVTDTYDYDAFGNLIAQSGSGTPNNYLFTGEQFDPELGLYYLRARYMAPETGRFWNADTFEGFLVSPLSLHKYVYAHDNPINFVDPSGFSPLTLEQLGQTIRSLLEKTTKPITIKVAKKSVKKAACFTFEIVAEEAIFQGVYIFIDDFGAYVGKSVDVERRLKEHGKRVKALLAKIKFSGASPEDLRKIEQFILDQVRKGLNVGDEAVRGKGGKGKISNKINPLNKKAREFLRKTIKLC